MALIKEMLAQIEEEQKKKLEQIEIMEREKSIIPYAFASASSATKTPKEVYKAPETMVCSISRIKHTIYSLTV
jgi:hypothetical protein